MFAKGTGEIARADFAKEEVLAEQIAESFPQSAAAKELWQEEQRKHPYRRWLLTGFVFLYVLVHELLRWSEGKQRTVAPFFLRNYHFRKPV